MYQPNSLDYSTLAKKFVKLFKQLNEIEEGYKAKTIEIGYIASLLNSTHKQSFKTLEGLIHKTSSHVTIFNYVKDYLSTKGGDTT